MSEYLKIKAQIEALQQQLESVRVTELEAEITDMKKRIVAFGIRPEQLYAKEDLPTIIRASRIRKPPKYRHGDRSWSGEGDRPRWFAAALREGVKIEDMLIKPS